MIQKKFSHAASFRVIQARTTEGINLKQTAEIEQYCQDILQAMENCKTDLCGIGEHCDCIPIERLYQYVFIGGLNSTQFQMKLENFYAVNPTGSITTPLNEVMDDYITYANTRTISIKMGSHGEASTAFFTSSANIPAPNPTKFVPGFQSNGAFLSKDGTQIKCGIC